MSEQLTIANFTKETGFRFRVNKEQNARIEAGDLTRDGAFNEFLDNGGLKRLQERRPTIPASVYADPDLTVENFTQKVEAATGTKRRFRVSSEQGVRIEAGELTRAQALAEVVAQNAVKTEVSV